MSYDDFKIDFTPDDFKWLLKFVFYCGFFFGEIFILVKQIHVMLQ